MVLLVEDRATICADDGASGDAVSGDGLWACPGAAAGGGDSVAVLVDGRLLRGPLRLDDDAEHLDASRDLVASARPSPGEPGTPRAPTPTLLVELDLGPSEHAWMLHLVGPETEQLACMDDGSFPDAAANDGVATCAGPASRFERLAAQSPDGAQEAQNPFTEPAALMAARWTSDGLSVVSADLLDRMPAPSATGAPLPQPSAWGEPQPPPPGGGFPWTGLLGLAALVGAGVLIARPPRGLPPGVEPVVSAEGPIHHDADPDLSVLAATGPVVVASPEPPAVSGPTVVLHTREVDALDLLALLKRLARTDPLRPPTLVVVGADRLVHPHGLGVSPLDALAQELPRGARIVVAS